MQNRKKKNHNKTENNKRGCGEIGTLAVSPCRWDVKWYSSYWKTVWQLLKKFKTELPYDTVIPILSIYKKES